MLNNKKILITGVIRNGEKKLAEEIDCLKKAFSDFEQIDWLIVESDSEDRTVEVLSSIAASDKKFKFFSLGHLSEKIKFRTERIAYCRNFYLEKIKHEAAYEDIGYVVVADLDGVNNALTQEAIKSCFNRTDWSVCAANQSGNYFDIWALRHPIWSPVDCWEQHRFLCQYLHSSESQKRHDLTFGAIYSKMIIIPQDAQWIEVDSAFGGLAIYKKEYLKNGSYIGLTREGREICEHVSLHFSIRDDGGKIFINPKLINTDFTEHSAMFKPKNKSLLYC
ncbi:hypothetical protein AOC23_07640 [Polynucleobacter paneuropaeus]|jgi:hypothetical protein|uniref:hypothetical protein n=1 Tax=Polynucleobacter paneuropaeus TaxID=2527775 RepID=UPI001BFD1FE8|nr:hypothetical protein [Polynucleobacter paneuropaeus]MBT8631939.1 hypothetical protein [Polynucleobacter paneuropaeus]QWD39166.1 hypothetical protein G6669_00710 [Polynucleobacter paneuropaeus]